MSQQMSLAQSLSSTQVQNEHSGIVSQTDPLTFDAMQNEEGASQGGSQENGEDWSIGQRWLSTNGPIEREGAFFRMVTVDEDNTFDAGNADTRSKSGISSQEAQAVSSLLNLAVERGEQQFCKDKPGSSRRGTMQQSTSTMMLQDKLQRTTACLSGLLAQQINSRSVVLELKIAGGTRHVNVLYAPQGDQRQCQQYAQTLLSSETVNQIFEGLTKTDTPEAVSTLLNEVNNDGSLVFKYGCLLNTVSNLRHGFWLDSLQSPVVVHPKGSKYPADSLAPGELDWIVKILMDYVVAVGCASQPFGMRYLHCTQFLHDMVNGQAWGARAGREKGVRASRKGRIMSISQNIVAAVGAAQEANTAGQVTATNEFVALSPDYTVQQKPVKGPVASAFVEKVRAVLFGSVLPLASRTNSDQVNRQASDVASNCQYPFPRPSCHHVLLLNIPSCLLAMAKLS